ncbi:MAG: hypothetical protein K8T10_03020 [Candidatus Eremiobacteraeota bacterium]|nr:hypothetical protein [Candidatus Eremiobacteraeota bacterium]
MKIYWKFSIKLFSENDENKLSVRTPAIEMFQGNYSPQRSRREEKVFIQTTPGFGWRPVSRPAWKWYKIETGSLFYSEGSEQLQEKEENFQII